MPELIIATFYFNLKKTIMQNKINFRKKILTVLLGSLFLLSFSACEKDDDPVVAGNTITDVVTNTSNFSTLEAAVIKAGLATTLSSPGPFTVFAPDDNAFQQAGITTAVLNSLTQAQVSDILLYHTIAAKVMAAQVPAGPNAAVATAGGDSVYLTSNANGVFVNGIKVTQADVAASNGVIHAIGSLLMPPTGNIVEMAQADTTFSLLVEAVLRASQGSTNVAQVLSGNGPFTVFAPTNAAFRSAGFQDAASIQATDPDVLAGILTYHVIGARVFSSDLLDGQQPTTVNGGKVTIGLTGGATVKGISNTTASNIIATNIVADNGVIHVIDQVLLP